MTLMPTTYRSCWLITRPPRYLPIRSKARREGLRFVAMAAMGATRLAVDTWLAQDGKRPLAKYIQDAFKTLKAEI